MKKILLLFLLYIGIWQQMHAQQFISGNLVYVITSQTTVKLGAQNPNLVGNITIPASVVYNNQPYTVTNIGDYSFYNQTAITSVVIPNNVTTIGYAAFLFCQSLTSVVISNTVISIDDYAFGLTGLNSIICNAITPPILQYNTFLSVNLVACSLTVPNVSLTAYQVATFWQNFYTIIGAAPLPIELVSFAANCEKNNTVSVNWTTASEHNSDYYMVEKSRDGSTWNVLKTIQAAENSTQLINYSVDDATDISGTIYYRLTQVDVDGALKVYDIVSTICSSEKEFTLITYPNPSNGQFSLKIENAKGGEYFLIITDMQGIIIEQQIFDLESGTTIVKLNPANVHPGVYLLKVIQDGNVVNQQKLVID